MKKDPCLPKNKSGKNIIIEQKKRRLEIKIKLKAKMIVLKRESVFNPQLLVLELLHVSDDRRWVPGAKATPLVNFRVEGDGLGFDGSLRGPDRNMPRATSPGWFVGLHFCLG